MTAAVTGTSTERKTTPSSSEDSTTTAITNSGNRAWRRSPMSVQVAVWPPTWAWAERPASAAGSTSARSRSMVARVASSWGAVAGSATTVATPPWRSGGATDAMPGSAATASRTASAARASSTAIVSGPLAPGPKPWATRS